MSLMPSSVHPQSSLPPIVLLVENDPDTREMYETALNVDGLWVAEASSASDALEYASELRPDAVVTDLSLGGHLEGVALAEQLRQQPATADIPIVAVTGLDLERLGERRTLFSTVLQKPVTPEGLIRDVRSSIAAAAELRARGQRPRSRIPELLERPGERLIRSDRIAARVAQWMSVPRGCPRCGHEMRWVEDRAIDGVLFDYYEPCRRGCGLFCYDRALRRFVTLIG